jgi:hypothetical protein
MYSFPLLLFLELCSRGSRTVVIILIFKEKPITVQKLIMYPRYGYNKILTKCLVMYSKSYDAHMYIYVSIPLHASCPLSCFLSTFMLLMLQKLIE